MSVEVPTWWQKWNWQILGSNPLPAPFQNPVNTTPCVVITIPIVLSRKHTLTVINTIKNDNRRGSYARTDSSVYSNDTLWGLLAVARRVTVGETAPKFQLANESG